MRKLLIIFVISILAGTAAYGEETATIPEGKLRLSLIQGPGFTHKRPLVNWDWGFGAEYGITDWLNVQFLWNPAVKIRPEVEGGTMFLGLKGGIVGENAPVPSDRVRLSAALGILIPPTDKKPDLLDQDQNLWGSALRLYSDFVISRYFYINLFFEGDFYPPQRADGNVFYGETVSHYLDLAGEMELNFQTPPLKDGLVLKYGAPVKIFYAPYMNADGEQAGSQYCLSAGAYFGAALPPKGSPALEWYARYNTNIMGRNTGPFHRVSFIIRMTLPPGDKEKEGTS